MNTPKICEGESGGGKLTRRFMPVSQNQSLDAVSADRQADGVGVEGFLEQRFRLGFDGAAVDPSPTVRAFEGDALPHAGESPSVASWPQILA